ncbi:MAG: T9SS type A sorting domain-containing protein, partial [Bacteroidota bacterium]
ARREVGNASAPVQKDAGPLAVALRLAPEAESPLPVGARSEAHVVLGTPEAHTGVDALDAYALTPPAQAYVQIASLAASGEGETLALSVDHRAALDDAVVEIPLVVSAVGAEGETGLVLTWDAVAAPEGTRVWLSDRETGTQIDLTESGAYAFRVSPAASGETNQNDVLSLLTAPRVQRAPEAALTGGSRFALVIEPASVVSTEDGAGAVAVSEMMPNPTRDRSALRLSVDVPQRVRVSVHDALGREVLTVLDREVSSVSDVAVETRGLASGAYVVRVVGETFAETRRLTIAR